MKRPDSHPANALTQARVKELLGYDPETGKLWWLLKRQGVRHAGAEAGSWHKQGYRVVRIDDWTYTVQRIVWLWMTGRWPHGEIDHRDLNKSNNAWANLREAEPYQNCGNRTVRADSESRIKGVFQRKDRRSKRWRAVITYQGVKRHLGYFNTEQDARSAYARAANEYLGKFARE